MKDLKELKIEINELLKEFAISADLLGYKYIIDGIIEIINDEDKYRISFCELYKQLAVKHNTTSSRIERCIRHAIEKAMCYGNLKILEQYFGYCIKKTGTVTNSQFLYNIANELILKYE